MIDGSIMHSGVLRVAGLLMSLCLIFGCEGGAADTEVLIDTDMESGDMSPSGPCAFKEDCDFCLPALCSEENAVSNRYFDDDAGVCGVALPMLSDWACPSGWLEEVYTPPATPGGTLRPVVTCRPNLPPDDCALGEVPTLDGSGCIDLDMYCPTAGQRWHSEEVLRERAPSYDGQILYVDASAPVAGANGSKQSPYIALGDAIEASASGDIIALAPGEYAEPVVIAQRRVAVLGACAGQTTLTDAEMSAPGRFEPVLGIVFGVVLIADLRIAPNVRGGISIIGSFFDKERGTVVGERSTVEIRRVRIEWANGVGLETKDGSDVVVEESIIRNTQPWLRGQTSLHLAGHGIDMDVARGNGELTVRKSLIDGNGYTGIFVQGIGTEPYMPKVTISDSTISNTNGVEGVNIASSGLEIQFPADVWVQRTLLDRNRALGVSITREAAVRMNDVVISNTRPTPREVLGIGLYVSSGAQVILNQSIIDKNHSVGAVVDAVGELIQTPEDETLPYGTGGDTTLDLTKVLVQNTQPRVSDDTHGRGVSVQWGGTLVARELIIDNSHELGFLATGSVRTKFDPNPFWFEARERGTRVELYDTLITNVQPQRRTGALGDGFALQSLATGKAQRLLIANTLSSALRVLGEGARLSAEDITVHNIVPIPANDGSSASGFAVFVNGFLDVNRASITEVHGTSVFVSSAEAMFKNIMVSDTRAVNYVSDRLGDTCLSRGLVAQRGAQVSVDGLHVTDTQEVGVYISGIGTHVEASNVVVERTTDCGCNDGAECLVSTRGSGFVGTRGATGSVDQFVVVDNDTGVFIEPSAPSEIAWRNGFFGTNTRGIGVCDDALIDRLFKDSIFGQSGQAMCSNTQDLPATCASEAPLPDIDTDILNQLYGP